MALYDFDLETLTDKDPGLGRARADESIRCPEASSAGPAAQQLATSWVTDKATAEA
eukprot:CAMPEP_0171075918 /NCGR_PEP_ID=MMETSP0766_2-20121228/13078_1 /TAXON_ID=439317 /ORGANISM="Gambierdiscus australes, Strain CAWD 149" /LENGTH=55 /DNA_ID=CAMNT_0011532827 /DNA_START=101 /DNA_END=268 /DNA_ORIENTATION=+